MKRMRCSIRCGRKVYHINFFRLFLSFALLISISILSVEGIYAWRERSAFSRQFSALHIEEMPETDAVIKRCIVVSAGHGGSDPGACVGDVQEKDINLSIAQLVHDLLRDKGYTVLMTRMEDTELDDTATIMESNENAIDLYIAIHQNSQDGSNSARGIETWYEQGRQESRVLAEYVQASVIAVTGAQDRGIRCEQSFEVTRETVMPSVLIETGFLTNDAEREALLDAAYQQRIAEGIVQGIDAYFTQEDIPDTAFQFER